MNRQNKTKSYNKCVLSIWGYAKILTIAILVSAGFFLLVEDCASSLVKISVLSTKFVAFLPYRLAFSRSILKAPQLSSRIPNTILPMFSCYRPQQLHPSFYSSFPVTDHSSNTFLLLKLSSYRLQQ